MPARYLFIQFLTRLLICTQSLLYGCAGHSLPNAHHQRDQESDFPVWIVYPKYDPIVEVDVDIVKGKGKVPSKAKGVALGAGAGAGALNATANVCGPAAPADFGDEILVLLAFEVVCIPVAATTGAVYGAVKFASTYDANRETKTEPAGDRNPPEDELRPLIPRVSQQKLANAVHEKLAEVSPSLPVLISRNSIDGAYRGDNYHTILKVTFQKIIFKKYEWKNDLICLQMQATATKLDALTKQPLGTITAVFNGDCASYYGWHNNGGSKITEEVETGYDILSEKIADELYLLYHPAVKNTAGVWAGNRRVPEFVLAPKSPALKESWFRIRGPSFFGGFQATELSSLNPTFRWETFPREFDDFTMVGRDPEDVTYEFRLYEGKVIPVGARDVVAPLRVLHTARGLKDNYYEYPHELTPCTWYFWTVRAKFYLNGYPRIIAWTEVYDSSSEVEVYPSYKKKRNRTGDSKARRWPVSSYLYFPVRTSGCARPPGADCENKSAANPWILSTDVKPACESADLGHADAQTYIGDIFYLGSHGNKDLVHAYVWYSLAAENAGACGSEYAANQLTKLRKQLAPGQIAEARHQLEHWQLGQCEKLLEDSNFQRK